MASPKNITICAFGRNCNNRHCSFWHHENLCGYYLQDKCEYDADCCWWHPAYTNGKFDLGNGRIGRLPKGFVVRHKPVESTEQQTEQKTAAIEKPTAKTVVLRIAAPIATKWTAAPKPITPELDMPAIVKAIGTAHRGDSSQLDKLTITATTRQQQLKTLLEEAIAQLTQLTDVAELMEVEVDTVQSADKDLTPALSDEAVVAAIGNAYIGDFTLLKEYINTATYRQQRLEELVAKIDTQLAQMKSATEKIAALAAKKAAVAAVEPVDHVAAAVEPVAC